MIKLYTRTVCPKCMLAKQLLDGANIKYEVVNLDFDEVALAEIQEKGFMALPILRDEDGNYHVDTIQVQSFISSMKKS